MSHDHANDKEVNEQHKQPPNNNNNEKNTCIYINTLKLMVRGNFSNDVAHVAHTRASSCHG